MASPARRRLLLLGALLFIALTLTVLPVGRFRGQVSPGSCLLAGSSPSTLAAVGSKMYVVNSQGTTVTMVDPVAGTKKTIDVGGLPYGIVAVGTKVYVTVGSNTVAVIDATSDTVLSSITVGSFPAMVAAFGTKVYVANHDGQSVSVIDTVSDTVTKTVTVGNIPVDFGMIGSRVFVVNQQDSTVSVIDSTSDTVEKTISVGRSPFMLYINGTSVFVPAIDDGTVSIIDTAKDDAVTTTSLDGSMGRILLANRKLYVVDPSKGKVVVLSPETGFVFSRIPVGQRPIRLTGVGNKVYVVDDAANTVTVIDALTDTVSATLNVGKSPTDLFVFGTEGYVPNKDDGTLSVIDLTTDTVITSCSVASSAASTATVCGNGFKEGAEQCERGSPCAEGLTCQNCTCVTCPACPAGFSNNSYCQCIQNLPLCGNGALDPNEFCEPANNTCGSPYVCSNACSCAEIFPLCGNGTLDSREQCDGASNPCAAGQVCDNACQCRTAPAASSAASSAPIASSAPASSAASEPLCGNGVINTGESCDGLTNLTRPDVTACVDCKVTPLQWCVDIGDGPGAIAVSPSGSQAYIANVILPKVTILDTRTNTVIASMPLADKPSALMVAPDNSQLYVLRPGDGATSGAVSVLKPSVPSFLRNITVGKLPWKMLLSPNGGLLYVANRDSNSISVINTATYALAATIAVGDTPVALAITPDGTKLYVTKGINLGSVSIIDTTTNTMRNFLATNVPVSISPDGTKAYAGDSIYSTATDAIITKLPVSVGRLAFSPDGKKAFEAQPSSIRVIATDTNTVAATIKVGNYPTLPVFTPDSTKAYVLNTSSNTVSVLSTITNTVTKTIAVGPRPADIAMTPDGKRVLVTNSGHYSLSIIDTATDTALDCTASVLCGNGVSDAGEQCGEPGLTCASGNDCIDCQCICHIPGQVAATTPGDKIAITPDGQKAYLLNHDYPPTGFKENIDLAVISTLNSAVTNRLNSFGDRLAMTPNGQWIWAGTHIFRTDTDELVGNQSIGPFTFTHDGTLQVSLNGDQFMVRPVDTTGMSVDPAPTAVISGAQSFSLLPNDAKAYVVDTAGAISVVSLQGGAITNVLSTQAAAPPFIMPNGSKAYIIAGNCHPPVRTTPYSGPELCVLRTSDDTITKTIPLTGLPNSIVFTPDNKKAYISNAQNGTVSVMSTVSDTVTTILHIADSLNGGGISGLSITPDGKYVYIAGGGVGTITVIDTSTDAIFKTIQKLSPWGIQTFAVTPDSAKVYGVGTAGIDVLYTSRDAITLCGKTTVTQQPTSTCGNGTCEEGETAVSCAQDCACTPAAQGGDLTYGTPVEFAGFGGFPASSMEARALDANRVAILYNTCNSSPCSTDSTKVVIATITGKDVAFGQPFAIPVSRSIYSKMIALDSSHLIVSVGCQLTLLIVNGTQITAGSAQTFSSSSGCTGVMAMAPVGLPNSFMIGYQLQFGPTMRIATVDLQSGTMQFAAETPSYGGGGGGISLIPRPGGGLLVLTMAPVMMTMRESMLATLLAWAGPRPGGWVQVYKYPEGNPPNTNYAVPNVSSIPAAVAALDDSTFIFAPVAIPDANGDLSGQMGVGIEFPNGAWLSTPSDITASDSPSFMQYAGGILMSYSRCPINASCIRRVVLDKVKATLEVEGLASAPISVNLGVKVGDRKVLFLQKGANNAMPKAVVGEWPCTVPVSQTCGNGLQEGTEECETGIPCTSGDCNTLTCKCVGASSSSSFGPSSSGGEGEGAVCGDGIREGTEQCEINVACTIGTCNTTTCQCSGAQSSTGAGSSGGAGGSAAECGNGLIEGTEQCEIGIACADGLSCVSPCQCVANSTVCGNGIREGTEGCETGIPCTTGTCDTATCQCSGATSSGGGDGTTGECGNGTIEGLEECEIGVSCNAGQRCVPDCQCSALAYCGDGVVEASNGEQCELNADCAAGKVCDMQCQCITGTGDSCGNGVKEGVEQCEQGIACEDSSKICNNCLCADAPRCGNGLMERGEVCEIGYRCPEGSTCSNCQCFAAAVCGNSILEIGEQCETDAQCQTGQTCNRSTCQCSGSTTGEMCGNGLMESAEQCEISRPCDDGTKTCTLARCECASVAVVAQCGNSIIDPGEDCEIGRGCSQGQFCNMANCHCTQQVNRCGDGVLAGGEECELGVACTDSAQTCDMRRCACTAPVEDGVCGNGILSPGEECEVGLPCGFGWSCNFSTCLCLTQAVCGDGRLNEGEQCESNVACTGENQTCDFTTCRCRGRMAICGNGTLDVGEECDDGNKKNNDGCSMDCKVELSESLVAGSALCGNGIVEPPEECDDGNLVSGDGCSPSCTIEILMPDGTRRTDIQILPNGTITFGSSVRGAAPGASSVSVVNGTKESSALTPGKTLPDLTPWVAGGSLPPALASQNGLGQAGVAGDRSGQLVGGLPTQRTQVAGGMSQYYGVALPLSSAHGPAGQTGPEVAVIIVAGAAGGWAWLRRRRRN